MSVPLIPLFSQVNKNLENSLTSADLAKVSSAIQKISQIRGVSVPTFSNLPPASDSTGMIIYVVDVGLHYSSDGSSWNRDFSSEFKGIFVQTWGAGSYGKLGDNTLVNKSSPVSVVGGFTDWCQVSAGVLHTAGIRSNGTAWAWGFGTSGRLGDGAASNRLSPVSVVGGFTDWCQISAGDCHTAAIRTDGSLWAWGAGNYGRLGGGNTTSRSSPVSVVGGFTDWCQVSAGACHTAAIRTNGTLWTWGYGYLGNLGDSTAISKSSPVSVVGGFTDWCQVSAGPWITAAVRTNGTLWSWGWGIYSPLGGVSSVASSPVSVVGGFTDWCQVSAGSGHTAAVRTNGTLWTWGDGTLGQLGDGTTVDKSSPVSVVGGFTDWCQVSAGSIHTTGIRANGTIWAWGFNNSGRLGDGTVIDRSSPVPVTGGFTNWCQVSAGGLHTAAIRIGKGF